MKPGTPLLVVIFGSHHRFKIGKSHFLWRPRFGGSYIWAVNWLGIHVGYDTTWTPEEGGT